MSSEERAQVAQNMYLQREILWRTVLHCAMLIIPVQVIIILVALGAQVFVYTFPWPRFILGLFIVVGIAAAVEYLLLFGQIYTRNMNRAEQFLNLDINMDGKIAAQLQKPTVKVTGPPNDSRGVYIGEIDESED